MNFFIAACWSAIITFVVFLILNGILIVFCKKKALKKARQEGHEVIAKYVNQRSEYDSTYTWGYYEFEYNGKKYKFHDRYITEPPLSETLYFKKNPKRAKRENDFGGVESYGWCVVVFLVVWLCFW